MTQQLTRSQWEQLENQMSRTPAESDADGVLGEHMQLIALLNKFGYNPKSKRAAMALAEQLLQAGWDESTQ